MDSGIEDVAVVWIEKLAETLKEPEMGVQLLSILEFDAVNKIESLLEDLLLYTFL